MSRLKSIENTVQQVAEAISHAIGIEAEIVDRELTIIGGTGFYEKLIGKKEEYGEVDGRYLYARVLRQGKSVITEDACNDLTYDPMVEIGQATEMAEICTPILLNGEIIGVIGLIAFDNRQKDRLLKNREHMVHFLERMADLIAAKVLQSEVLQQVETAKSEIETILETIHEAMIAVNSSGYITYCNSNAEVLLKLSKVDIVGKHLGIILPDTLALKVIKTGKGFVEKEEAFNYGNHNYNFIVTAKPIHDNKRVNGVVISFRDIIEAQKLVYKMNKPIFKYSIDDILGRSKSIDKVKNQALLIAKGDSTVLISGESGTGKELFAKAIHYAGSRKKSHFVTVNCGAIPHSLMESELFGYEGGAFTGAKHNGKIGKFELAHKGTIFLDEVGELPLHMQVKLLHVLQNKSFEKVGGNNTIHVDVRVISATNRNLEEMIKKKEFRSDLYYRLNVIPLKIPPLRDRSQDIRILMNYFLNKYNIQVNKRIRGFSSEVEDIYYVYDWPGNVRELENAVEYGVNLCFGDMIEIDAIPPRISKSSILARVDSKKASLKELKNRYEEDLLTDKINKYGKSFDAKVTIAKELGINQATLYRKLAKYNIT